MPTARFHKFLHRHRAALLLFICVYAVSALAIHFNSRVLNERITITILKNMDRKAMDASALFHETTEMVVRDRLSQNVLALERIALSQQIQELVMNKDYRALESEFDELRSLGKRFDSLILLTPDGYNLLLSTDTPNKSSYVGKRTNFSDVYEVPVKTHQSYIGKVIYTLANTYVVPISVPVFDTTGEIIAVLRGSMRLVNFEDRIRIPQNIDGYTYALVDQDGTLIYDGTPQAVPPINLSSTNPVVSRLLGGESYVVDQLTDAAGRKMWMTGSTIEINGTKFYWITSYPTAALELEKINFMQDINNMHWLVTAVAWVMVTIGYSLCYLIMIKHICPQDEQ